ncbi:MAG: orotidine 5'-phosphate decarboxylase / HUMPS family protein, partial [Candidatus Bathyarchaeia archaeon]
RGVLLLVYMSHKASHEGYGQSIYDPSTGRNKPQYVIFAEKALVWKADGAIVGATYPDKIKEVYAVLKDKIPIYSPGIGVQGGDLEAAVTSGAHYLIVGRSIIYADKPDEAAKTIRDLAAKFLKPRWSSRP